jgi:gliding-associated putative ABC transporter substrate-binding component GldG
MQNLIEKFTNSKRARTTLLVLLFLNFNWFSYGFYLRADISREGLLRLTSSTKDLLQSAPEQISIEAFFSGDVPDAAVQKVKQLEDFLREYAGSSNGNVKLTFLDPDKDSEAKSRVRELGIRPMSMGSLDRTKQEFASVYFSAAISYEDRVELIPNLLDSQVLEYDLTMKIYKMIKPGERKIGFIEEVGPFSLRNEQNPFVSLDLVNQALNAFYGSMVPVNLAQGPVPSDIKTLFLVGPLELDDLQKFHIDQYIMRGGNLVLAVNGLTINFQNLMANAIPEDILEFFGGYGLEIGSDMILEPSNYLPLRQRQGFQVMEIPYPAWVSLSKENMKGDHPITKSIPSIFAPYASSLSINAETLKKGENISSTILASTSSESWLQKNFAVINPQRQREILESEERDNIGANTVIAIVKGKFASYYQSRALPESIGGEFLAKGERSASILVLSTPYALSDVAIQQGEGVNLNFILSGVDTLSGLEELVDLRKKNVKNPEVKNLKPQTRDMITALNFISPLALIVIVGLLRFKVRKAREQVSSKQRRRSQREEA